MFFDSGWLTRPGLNRTTLIVPVGRKRRRAHIVGVWKSKKSRRSFENEPATLVFICRARLLLDQHRRRTARTSLSREGQPGQLSHSLKSRGERLEISED
jgi:hypothetical protein